MSELRLRSRGRQSTYTPEKACLLLELIALGIPMAVIHRGGNELIHWCGRKQVDFRALCFEIGIKADEALTSMPAPSTIADWKLAHPTDFAVEFGRAKDEGFDAIAVETLMIADTPLDAQTETVKTGGESGDEVTTKTEDALGHRTLQINTRLKLLSKWDPRRYGDKLVLSGDDDAPIRTIRRIERVIVDPAKPS